MQGLWKLGELASDKKALRTRLQWQKLIADSDWGQLRAWGSSPQVLMGIPALFTWERKVWGSLSRPADTVVAWRTLWAGSVNSPSSLLSFLHVRVSRVKVSLKPGWGFSLGSAEQKQPQAAGKEGVICGRGVLPGPLWRVCALWALVSLVLRSSQVYHGSPPGQSWGGWLFSVVAASPLILSYLLVLKETV